MASKSQQKRLDALHAMACIACALDGSALWGGRIEAHHLVDRGNRKASGGHVATIPLCAWHHRAEPPHWAPNKRAAESLLGPSLAESKREFVKRYGTERELLERVNCTLAG